MYETFYFCLKLTENEHYIVEDEIRDFLKKHTDDCRIIYYRKLKDGHVPMIREIKIEGSTSSIDCFKRWVTNYPKPSKALIQYVVKNPHKVKINDSNEKNKN